MSCQIEQKIKNIKTAISSSQSVTQRWQKTKVEVEVVIHSSMTLVAGLIQSMLTN